MIDQCKSLIPFFQWLIFGGIDEKNIGTRIIKIEGINNFLVDIDHNNHQGTVTPIWDLQRIKYLFFRIIRKELWYRKRLYGDEYIIRKYWITK